MYGPIINGTEVHWFQRDFDEQEILEGLKACTSDKDPCPDGYTMWVFSHCWDIIKGDLLLTFQNHSHE